MFFNPFYILLQNLLRFGFAAAIGCIAAARRFLLPAGFLGRGGALPLLPPGSGVYLFDIKLRIV